MDPGAVYADTRRRLTALVRSLPPADVDRRVPAAPLWTVKDAVGHLVGIVDDTLAGRLEGVGTDEWTAAQVDARRDRSLDELIAEWEERAPDMEAAMGGWKPYAAAAAIGDLVTHAHDVRAAVGRPGDRDTAGVAVATELYSDSLGRRLHKGGFPALRLDTGEWSRQAGTGAVGATVRGEPFELLRAMTGRRSRAQIAELGWTGDPAPYLDVFSTYPLPAEDLVE
jgi:uncharacterized protein (TIGR03083 family)